MRLEEQARVQHWLAQHAVGQQLQHDQQPPEASVAVEKRMDGLELDMDERRLDQRRHGLGVVVEEALERRQAIRHCIGRGRDEGRVAWPGAPDPDLGAAHFTGRPAPAAGMRQQHLVHLAEQARAQRQPAAQILQTAFERRDAAADLARILHRHAGLLVDLVQQQVRQRGLRALDLRGQHRLLAHEAAEQQRRVGQQRRHRVQPPQRHQRRVKAPPPRRPRPG
jgi:hypothetical protein